MPQHLEDSRFISSMSSSWSSYEIDHYLFWAKAWTLVGDVYVEFHLENQKTKPPPAAAHELKMSPQVEKELQRLKKKLAKSNQSCSSCSLVNCSCQSDRVSSGSSASSSTTRNTRFSRVKKQTEKTVPKVISQNIMNENEDAKSCKDTQEETPSSDGGIFRYIDGYEHIDADHTLTSARICYEEAIKCLDDHPTTSSSELKSLVKKKGWVCNELGRRRLERKEISKAEEAFSEAITSFKKVSDHNNIILINLNLGHGRRSAAEEIVSQMEPFRDHPVFKNTYNQKLDAAKSQNCESLRFFRAVKKQVDASDVINDLSNDVYTQFAHTYLRLGMLLARENTTAKVYKSKKEFGKCEISASDAISEALCMYELLGDLRKQEAAYAYFQLACYQSDCGLRLLEMELKKSNLSKCENNVFQRAKQFSSMAERNWHKSMQFYGPKTHSTMYLTILIEMADLSCRLSKSSHAYVMLESALNSLLEGLHVPADGITLQKDDCRVYERFWGRLQTTLKSMLSVALPAATNKSVAPSQQTGDARSSKTLYVIFEGYRLQSAAGYLQVVGIIGKTHSVLHMRFDYLYALM